LAKIELAGAASLKIFLWSTDLPCVLDCLQSVSLKLGWVASCAFIEATARRHRGLIEAHFGFSAVTASLKRRIQHQHLYC